MPNPLDHPLGTTPRLLLSLGFGNANRVDPRDERILEQLNDITYMALLARPLGQVPSHAWSVTQADVHSGIVPRSSVLGQLDKSGGAEFWRSASTSRFVECTEILRRTRNNTSRGRRAFAQWYALWKDAIRMLRISHAYFNCTPHSYITFPAMLACVDSGLPTAVLRHTSIQGVCYLAHKPNAPIEPGNPDTLWSDLDPIVSTRLRASILQVSNAVHAVPHAYMAGKWTPSGEEWSWAKHAMRRLARPTPAQPSPPSRAPVVQATTRDKHPVGTDRGVAIGEFRRNSLAFRESGAAKGSFYRAMRIPRTMLRSARVTLLRSAYRLATAVRRR